MIAVLNSSFTSVHLSLVMVQYVFILVKPWLIIHVHISPISLLVLSDKCGAALRQQETSRQGNQ